MDIRGRKSWLINSVKLAACAIVLVTIAACVPQWARVSDANAAAQTESGYVATLPAGWVRLSNPLAKNESLASRDGVRVQWLVVGSRKAAEAFPRIQKQAQKNALPTELADLEIAEQIALMKPLVIKVAGSTAVTVAGQRGFRLLTEYKTETGLTMRRLTVAWLSGDYYSFARFEAPALHYFQRDLPAFEQVLKSIQLQKT